MYQLFSVPAAITLNSSGMEYENYYISDEESYAIRWLADNEGGGIFYTDWTHGPRILASQGKIQKSRVRGSLIRDYHEGKDIVGYIFLFYPKMVKGETTMSVYSSRYFAPIPDMLTGRNKLFTSGLTEIYR